MTTAATQFPVPPGIIPPWQRELAAVCCYFNPCRYRARLHNYHAFRAGIVKTGIRLLTVELAIGLQDWELGDIPDVLRVRAQDVLWHKERLLNLGIAQLIREGFTKIAWLDADILFHDPAWPAKLSASLDRCVLSQAFALATRRRLRHDEPTTKPGTLHFLHRTGQLNRELTGLAWGARAELLSAHPLYDACIVGGGDRANCFAACYSQNNANAEAFFDSICESFLMTPAQKEHYRRWATPFGAFVDGRIGFIDSRVEALYHGEHAARFYTTRHKLLIDFDPFQDIAYNADGCWRWASAKPHLHQRLYDYFLLRNEDE